MADAKINLPVFGEVDKKYAAVGALAAGGIVAVVYLRRNAAKKAAALSANAGTTAGTGGTETDPAGNVGTIDPSTGYVYGSAEDQQILSSGQYGTSNYGGFGGGFGGGYGGNIDPLTGYPSGSIADEQALSVGTPATTGTTTPTAVTTNSQWLNEALGVIPGDSATATTAIASVLGGLTVTTDQRNLFMEAVGILGPPPQGYPTPIKTSDTAGQPTPPPKGNGGGTGTSAPTRVNPPFNVNGQTLAQARATIAGAGYHVNNVSGNQSGHVVSYTAYSDKSVNLGMS